MFLSIVNPMEEMQMSTPTILGILMLVLIIAGGVWGIIWALLSRDRKSIDEKAAEVEKQNLEARQAIWARVDDLRKDIIRLQIDQGVLQERIRAIPDHEELHSRLQAVQDRLELRIESLSHEVRETITSAMQNFKCPYAESEKVKS